MTPTEMRSTVFKRAWAIARSMFMSFGGNVKQYFSMSLVRAWAEWKAGKFVAKVKKAVKKTVEKIVSPIVEVVATKHIQLSLF